MVGDQRNYYVLWTCRTLVLAVGALLLISDCGGARAPQPHLHASPRLSTAHEEEKPSQNAHLRGGAGIGRELTSTVGGAGSCHRRLEGQTEAGRPDSSEAESSSSHEEKPKSTGASKVEKRQKLENPLGANEHGRRSEEKGANEDESGLEGETQDAAQPKTKIEASGSSLSASEATPDVKGNAAQAKHLSHKEDEDEEKHSKEKKTKGTKAPPVDPTAPIEELLDPAKIQMRSLVKTPFSQLTVKDVSKVTPPSYEYKRKTEGEAYGEARKVYADAKAVQERYDKDTDVAEAKASPPKRLSYHTRFIEASERFFSRWGKN